MSALGPELDDAVNAARGDDLGSGGLADATRERVLASLQQRGQRQRTMAAFATVLALSLLGTTSWAWVSGWLPAAIDRLRGEAPARVPDVPKGPKGHEIAVAQGGGPPLRPQPPELVLPELAPASEPAPTATRPEPGPRRPPALRAQGPGQRRTGSAPPTTTTATARAAVRDGSDAAGSDGSDARDAAGAPARNATVDAPARDATAAAPAAPSPDAEVGAFRAAHDAHFRGADPARALAAWDAYLAAYPRGRLVLEARWNRAIALLKLGHDREARAALAPFSAGAEGEYRQREARHLLDVLDQRSGK